MGLTFKYLMTEKIKYIFILLFCFLAFFSCKKTLKVDPIYLTEISDEDWPLYGNSPERSNYSATSLSPPLKNLWTYKASSAISPVLVAANGIVYANTLDGRLDAIDIKTGNRIGQIKTNESIETSSAFFDGDLFIVSRFGTETLARMDLETARFLWRTSAGDIATEPLVDNSGVYVSAIYRHIDKYDLETGDQLWSYKTEDQLHSSPALSEKTVVVGSDDGTIYALNTQDGTLNWKMDTDGAIFSTPIIYDGQIFVGSLDSTFYAINLNDGTLSWKYKTNYPIFQTAAISQGGDVFFGDSNGSFYSLRQDSGKLNWTFSAYSSISTSPLVAGEIVYFGSLDQKFYALSANDGKELWNFTAQGRIRTALVIWKDYLIGASEDKYIFCFKPEKEMVIK